MGVGLEVLQNLGKILSYHTLVLMLVLRPLKAAIKHILGCAVRQCCRQTAGKR